MFKEWWIETDETSRLRPSACILSGFSVPESSNLSSWLCRWLWVDFPPPFMFPFRNGCTLFTVKAFQGRQWHRMFWSESCSLLNDQDIVTLGRNNKYVFINTWAYIPLVCLLTWSLALGGCFVDGGLSLWADLVFMFRSFCVLLPNSRWTVQFCSRHTRSGANGLEPTAPNLAVTVELSHCRRDCR